MDSIVCHYTGGDINGSGVASAEGYCGHSNLYIVLLVIPALPISLIDSYTLLSYFSMFGVLMATIGILIMFGLLEKYTQKGLTVEEDLKVFAFAQVEGNIGVAMFVFEGNAVVINLKAEAKNKDAYSLILASSVMAVLAVFAVFACFAYYVFRSETNPIFTLSLYPINGLVTFVIVCVCVNAFISYPVQILVAFDIVEQHRFFKTGRRQKLKRVSVRCLIMICLAGVALCIPNLVVFLDIVGALGAGVIAFILPPLLYNTQFAETISPTLKYSNYLISLFGVVGSVMSII